MSPLSRIESSMDKVVWSRTLKEPVSKRPRVAADDSADLVVVGAGYCGLNIALHAARHGLSVILLEGETVGWGASGRNGGYMVPHFPGALAPSTVVAGLGRKKGEALCELVLGGASAGFDQIGTCQIQCDAEQNGWIQPAHSEKSLAAARKVYEDWRALGAAVSWLDQGEVSQLTGAAGYLGGWSNPTGGMLNPYGLALGLARAAEGLGARIFERSRADRFEREAGRTVVHTNGHHIAGRNVVLATNGYSATAEPVVQRSAIPVYLFQTATKPLSDAVLERIMPTRVCFTDLRKSGGFGRLDADNRLLSGGAVFAAGNQERYGRRHVRRRMKSLFPALGDADVELETYWEGYCAITPTFLPHVQIFGDGLTSIGGFSTRGVNLAQAAGRVVAEYIAGKRALDAMPFEVRDKRHDVPFWGLKARAARLVFPYYQAKDRFGFS